MRTIASFLILVGLAWPLHAQQRPASALQLEAAQPAAAAAGEHWLAPELPPAGDSLAITSRSVASTQPGAPAVLDEAFWRQVLAGVIVAVVSTLILRAIL